MLKMASTTAMSATKILRVDYKVDFLLFITTGAGFKPAGPGPYISNPVGHSLTLTKPNLIQKKHEKLLCKFDFKPVWYSLTLT